MAAKNVVKPETAPPEGTKRIRLLFDTKCQIDGELQDVKKGQTADVLEHLANHLIVNNLAEAV